MYEPILEASNGRLVVQVLLKPFKGQVMQLGSEFAYANIISARTYPIGE